MRIGLDFDNTIVSYDTVFHKIAQEQGLIPAEVPVNKLAVRDYLRTTGREEQWTEMQGYVYGARMDDADSYSGVIDFMQSALNGGHSLFIVSHKTRFPFLGTQYDLHAAARTWIARHLHRNAELLIPESQIYFELTKPEKINRIASIQCDVFIDDLPEILTADGFPASTERWLFDPEQHHADFEHLEIKPFKDWGEITRNLGLE